MFPTSESRRCWRSTATLLLAGLAACGSEPPSEPPGDGTVAYVGARILDGRGGALDDGVLLVRDGRIVGVGESADVEVPPGADSVDLGGRTVMPGLINAHGHVGGTLGLEEGHYTTENLRRQLRLYADYGVTTVVSLGGDGPEAIALRDSQDTPDLDRARLFVAGEVVTGATPQEALEVVQRNIQMGVNFIKIRVDDNLGTTEKMALDVYRAVIEGAHEAGLPLAAHVFYLDDARSLVAAGADLIAHSVRDTDVDDAFLSAMAEGDVCYTPTLLREVSTFVYGGDPAFFDDPFFRAYSDTVAAELLRDPARQDSVRKSAAAAAYRVALRQATANLRRVADAGVRIAMGTDTGPPGRFQGYFEHLELAYMAEAGMDPMSVIVAATGAAADCMRLEGVGTLEEGNWADFLVLADDPLIDVGATRSLEAVFIAGNRLDR